MDSKIHDFVSGAEFARAGNIPASRFARLLKAGRLRPLGKIGKAFIFSRSDLVRLPEILAEVSQ